MSTKAAHPGPTSLRSGEPLPTPSSRPFAGVRGAVADLLGRLGVTPPPMLHTVEAASAPSNTTDPA
jgi:hypothetical protein